MMTEDLHRFKRGDELLKSSHIRDSRVLVRVPLPVCRRGSLQGYLEGEGPSYWAYRS